MNLWIGATGLSVWGRQASVLPASKAPRGHIKALPLVRRAARMICHRDIRDHAHLAGKDGPMEARIVDVPPIEVRIEQGASAPNKEGYLCPPRRA